MTLKRFQQSGSSYIPADQQRFVDAVLAAFDPVFLLEPPALEIPRAGQFLSSACLDRVPRWSNKILASHPAVYGAGELIVVPQTFTAMPSVLGRTEQPIECVTHLDATAIQSLAQRHLDALQTFDRGRAERLVDKAPSNYQFLGFLTALFPQAVFIHCRRNLRDVAVSCWMTDFEHVPWSNDPEHLATYFQQYRRLMEHWENVFPAPIHHVDYEETVADLEPVVRGLLSACGLEWDPAWPFIARDGRCARQAPRRSTNRFTRDWSSAGNIRSTTWLICSRVCQHLKSGETKLRLRTRKRAASGHEMPLA